MAGPPVMPESSSPPMYTNTIMRNIRTEMAHTQWRWGASSTIGCSRTGSPRCHYDGEIGHPHQGLKLSFRPEVFMGLLEDLLSTSAFTLPHFFCTLHFFCPESKCISSFVCDSPGPVVPAVSPQLSRPSTGRGKGASRGPSGGPVTTSAPPPPLPSHPTSAHVCPRIESNAFTVSRSRSGYGPRSRLEKVHFFTGRQTIFFF